MEQEEVIQGAYYLKKCIMVLRSPQGLLALLPLTGRLLETGIHCGVLLSEEMLEEGACPQEERQGVLYLTDDPLVYAHLAADFRTSGKPPGRESEERLQPPVLIYLHPGNRGEDFADARYALEEPEEVEPEYLERVYRRCRNLSWEILTTEHCWLRETIEADVDNFWEMYQAPGITRYTERLFPTLEAERGYVREYRRRIYPFYEFGVWTVLDRSSKAVVGRAGLSVREGYRLPELGFVIGEPWQGRGLATEVCRGILEYARKLLGFTQVQVLVHEENTASLHLCRKLGFAERPAAAYAAEDIGRGESADVPGADRQKDGNRRENAGDIPADCLVEMEQNGKRAQFVYMVYESYEPAD